MKHIFLTGEKQIGKSTIIRSVMARHRGSMTGFLTYRTNSFCPPFFSVHYQIVDASFSPYDAKSTACAENFLFYCRAGAIRDDNADAWRHLPSGTSAAEWMLQQFHTLGEDVILPATGDLMILDELGPHEHESHFFQDCLFDALDRKSIPILGVVQDGRYPMFEQIASHPNVQLIRVTKENRDTLSDTLIL